MATFTFQIIKNKQHYIKIHYKNYDILNSQNNRTMMSTQRNNCMFHAAEPTLCCIISDTQTL